MANRPTEDFECSICRTTGQIIVNFIDVPDSYQERYCPICGERLYPTGKVATQYAKKET